MIVSLTLALTSTVPVATPAVRTPAPLALAAAVAAQDEHEAEIAAAGEDVEQLLALAEAWKAAGQDDAARAAWQRVLELDDANRAAHEGLRHHEYDGKWFETYTALAKYRRDEEQRMKDAGLVRFRDEWVPAADVRFLRLGWTKGEDGEWGSPTRRAARELAASRTAEGWVLQDLTWIEPSEQAELAAGKYKCGDEWLAGAAADEYHAVLGRWWEIPGDHFVVATTLPRTTDVQEAAWAVFWADSTFAELVRIFGVKPGDDASLVDLRGPSQTLPTVVVLRDVDQYNLFAAGAPDGGLPAAEREGFSSLHYAFFADSFFQPSATPDAPPVYRGGGTALYAFEDPSLGAFGAYAVRHAAAQSFIEAIDPSWEAIGNALAGENGQDPTSFWREKRVPRWLRYGAAAHVERYMLEPGAADPAANRKWALQNLAAHGGLGDLAELFEFSLSLDDIEASTQRIQRAGAVVAFLLDGGDTDVRAAHGAFKQALRSGEDTSPAVEALEAVLKDKRAQLEAFCQG